MHHIKAITALCIQSFRKWTKDYRIWSIAVILLILIHNNVYNVSAVAGYMGKNSSLWYFPFLYSQYHMKLIFTLPLVLIFCNAPFIDSNSMFMLLRSGKMHWTVSQILYMYFTSAAYYIFILIATILLSLPYAEISSEWGDIIYTLSYSKSIAQNLGFYFIGASGMVVKYFNPFSAIWFTFLMSWMCAVIIGLIIYLCNILTRNRAVGIFISGLIIVFSSYTEAFYPRLTRYSPVSWTTLNNINVGGKTFNPSFQYCLIIYFASIFILTAAVLICSKFKKIDLDLK